MEFVDILKEKNLPTWQESVLFKALEYQFIKTEQLDEAVKILSKYNGEDDFFIVVVMEMAWHTC